MSDFLLDLRPVAARSVRGVAERLLFSEDSWLEVRDTPLFGLATTQTGRADLWAPWYGDDGSLVAIAGRPVFDEPEWAEAEAAHEPGGLAARVIRRRYLDLGDRALERVNGNCAVIVFDAPRRRLHVVTDAGGVFPAFKACTAEGRVYGSHPDVLAAAAGETHRVDEISLAEFILSGTVTPPHTYYERVLAIGHGIVLTHDLAIGPLAPPLRRRHFDFSYRGSPDVPETDIAAQLAQALRRAVERRTLPRLGRPAVALSGGLDSRVILACSLARDHGVAFSCFDEPNLELRTAERIARTLAVPFLPLRREADYYANHAEEGVRISGGMGSLANNHFLGAVPALKREGAETLLTGCYCDYLFKALPLNRTTHWLTRRERLAPYQHAFYFDHFRSSTPLASRALDRMEDRVPSGLREQRSVEEVFQLEARRTFPLCYEGDNQQRLVPQRLTGWCPPFVDRDVLDVYCRIPYNFKLNRSIFRRVVLALAPDLRDVPDANTGAPIDASSASAWVRSNQARLRRQWQRRRRLSFSDESWPDWRQYAHRSPGLEALWTRPDPDAADLFRRLFDSSSLLDDDGALKRERPFLFVGLLTVKLWLGQRRR